MPGNYKYSICHECKQLKVDRGRGLCFSCKERLKKLGTLDRLYPTHKNYKASKPRKGKKRRNVVSGSEMPQGRMIKKPGGIWVWEVDPPKQVSPKSPEAG